MPISSGPTPALQFGVEDQQVFVESLKSELVGSGIIRNIEVEKSQDDLNIMVNFVQTMHYPNVHEYVLVVEMICLYEDLVGSRMYQISSSEGDTFWEKMNTDASEGKEKAAIKLIDALIPDIQNFILEVQAREILAAPEGVRI